MADGDNIPFPTFWSTSENDGGVAFYVAEGSEFVTTYAEQVATTVTVDTDTTQSSTITAAINSPMATVYQANTRDQDAEILYFIQNPDSTWGGYYPASAEAASGTRFTVQPSFSTQQAIAGPMRLNTTSSLSLSAITYSISWSASRTTSSEDTAVTRALLPNSTSARSTTARTTTTSSFSASILGAQTLNWGALVNSSETTSATTSAITHYAMRATTVQRRIGPLNFQTTTETTASAPRTITTTALALGSIGSATIATNGSFTASSGSTVSASQNQTVIGPAQITVNSPPALGRSIYATTGAADGLQAGGWFEFDGGATLSNFTFTALDGYGRRGQTLRPVTNSRVTILSNSVTFTKSGLDGTTTSSGVVSVAGDSSTISDAISQNGPTHFGGTVGRGGTIVEVAEAGAYINLISGPTTSFAGNATVLTEGEAAPINSWQPVWGVAPLQNRTFTRNGIIFALPRNSTALPPA